MKILAEFPTPRGPATCAGRVILVDLGKDRAHPIVTWWENTELGGRCHGHYFKVEELEIAKEDFAERCRRMC